MRATVQTQRYGGFWIRVGAYLIDAVALSVIGSLLASSAHLRTRRL